MSNQQDLLDFDHVEVFYVTRHMNGRVYFLKDMTSDTNQIEWTVDQRSALYFYTEDEARKHSKLIQKTRPGVSVIQGEVDILEDLDLDDVP